MINFQKDFQIWERKFVRYNLNRQFLDIFDIATNDILDDDRFFFKFIPSFRCFFSLFLKKQNRTIVNESRRVEWLGNKQWSEFDRVGSGKRHGSRTPETSESAEELAGAKFRKVRIKRDETKEKKKTWDNRSVTNFLFCFLRKLRRGWVLRDYGKPRIIEQKKPR